MCEVASIVSAVVAIAAAGTSTVASIQQDNAAGSAISEESKRQQMMQSRQAELVRQQEEQKAQARKIYQGLVPEGSEENVVKDQERYAELLKGRYQGVANPTNADPTADGTSVNTVGSTSFTSGGTPAVDAAYAKELNRAMATNNQTAGARAFLDALGFAQRDAGQRLQRGQEGIAQQAGFIGGNSRQMGLLEGLKDSSQVNFRNQLGAAATAGDNLKLVSQGLGAAANIGYGYGTSRTAAPSGTVTVGQGQPIT